MQKKETGTEKKAVNKHSAWLYWPYWVLALLIMLLLVLLLKSNERSNNINRQLNEEPSSTKQ